MNRIMNSHIWQGGRIGYGKEHEGPDYSNEEHRHFFEARQINIVEVDGVQKTLSPAEWAATVMTLRSKYSEFEDETRPGQYKLTWDQMVSVRDEARAVVAGDVVPGCDGDLCETCVISAECNTYQELRQAIPFDGSMAADPREPISAISDSRDAAL